MHRIRILLSLAATCLPVTLCVSSATGQTSPIPSISNRQFTGGSAKVKVTGSEQIDADVPINTQASISDDGHVWIQYLSLIHISEPTRLLSISYAVFCLKKK